MERKIRIIFSDDGTMTSEAEGFQGASCMVETAKLMDALKATPVDTKYKEEYYANEANNSVSI
jgi:hypothetical protein